MNTHAHKHKHNLLLLVLLLMLLLVVMIVACSFPAHNTCPLFLSPLPPLHTDVSWL